MGEGVYEMENSKISVLIADDNTLITNITPTFILKGKDYIEAFGTEIKEKGLNESAEC